MLTITQSQFRTLLATVGGVWLLAACSDSGQNPGQDTFERVDQTFLHVSKGDLYYGTRPIGSVSTQSLIIENRGADQYSLKQMSIDGTDADSFAAQGFTDTVLLPTESMQVDLSFLPSNEGRKAADFVVQYDTIKLVSDAVNNKEQLFYTARDLEVNGQIDEAIDDYSAYIAADPVTSNERLASIKLPILKQSQLYGDGPELDLYLLSLDQQIAGDYDGALASLRAFDILHKDSYLADDALYLSAYIQLMNLQNYQSALRALQNLRTDFPDTSYYDTALYAEAVAQRRIGNDALARDILLDLRSRHTGTDVLGIKLPKDNMVSRLWFNRASDALQAI